jgi:hypothetical protein
MEFVNTSTGAVYKTHYFFVTENGPKKQFC